MMVSLLPIALTVVGGFILVAALVSPNPGLWVASILVIAISTWIVGGAAAYPILIWMIALNWLPVVADVLYADLSGNPLGDGTLGPYRVQAVLGSLCALIALSAGMRLGTRAFSSEKGTATTPVGQPGISLSGAVLAFLVSYPFVLLVTIMAYSVSGLQQPVLALSLLKYAALYLLAAKVLESGRGYTWLVLALVVEVITGITGFFSNYKEPLFIVLIAAAASPRKPSIRIVAFVGTAMILVIWLSLVWTAVKPEYRQWVSGYSVAQTTIRPLEERVQFIVERVFTGAIDYEVTYLKLLRRIGYTEIYAKALARIDGGFVDEASRYGVAIQHVLMPRLLFPDKAALDDSALTTAITGEEIAEGTSISLGYIAEAHIDFGFPIMLIPIMLIGIMVGTGVKYFMTRPTPLIVRQAFATASLIAAFAYESNIEKALGGYMIGFVVLALVLKFGYPPLAGWITESPRRARRETISHTSA
jgi:hypothetical protein